MSGWVKVHRALASSDMWLKETFTRGQAWIDLIMLANFRDGWIIANGEKILIKRGQCGWSTVRLAKRWGWARKKARVFLKSLQQKGQQIQLESSNRTTIITIINYEKFQAKDGSFKSCDNLLVAPSSSKQKQKKGQPSGHQNIKKGPPKGPLYKKKKEEEERNSNTSITTKKLNYSEFVRLTESEYKKLIERNVKASALACIEELDNYIPNSDRKTPYKDHYRAINSWVLKKVKKEVKEETEQNSNDLSARDKAAMSIMANVRKRESKKGGLRIG